MPGKLFENYLGSAGVVLDGEWEAGVESHIKKGSNFSHHTHPSLAPFKPQMEVCWDLTTHAEALDECSTHERHRLFHFFSLLSLEFSITRLKER